jgi:hypothetical protein
MNHQTYEVLKTRKSFYYYFNTGKMIFDCSW